ncbi:MAG: C25 family cysteine peptidase, partial [Sphingobacteriales bacterium]
WDSLARRYVFQKNIYSDSAWYFINIGSQGKRVTSAPVVLASQINTEVDAVYAYELDETNFLQSGKEWYGEEFGTGFGRTTTRDFTIPVQHVVPNSPMIISIDVLGRTVGVVSRFEISLNNSPFQQIILPSFSGAVYDPVGSPMAQTSVLTAPSSTLKLTLQFVPGNSNAQGWLNRFEWNGKIRLDMRNLSQLHFRDKKNNLNQTLRYAIDNAPTGTRVLDVTDFLNPVEQNLARTGTTIYFNADVSSAREYVAFTPEQFLSPIPGARIPNQNLHGAANPNYIIVTHPIFKNDANRIGRYHLQKRGLRYLIADVQQIYNEFSSGSPDPTAIRDFVKMFYDRAAGDSMKIPQYLLLLGDASY